VFSTKEAKIIRKVKRLLRQAGVPRWLHQFGPKKYEFYQHFLALLVREITKASYRRIAWLLDLLGFPTPTYSALAKMAKRISPTLWNALMAATIRFQKTLVAAIDGTYFSRNNSSFHYLKRMKRKLPLKRAVQFVGLLDTKRKKWISGKIRLVRRHESVDFEEVVDAAVAPPRKIVADKASDSEAIHKFCNRRRIEPHIPPRRNVVKGLQRRKHLKLFRTRTYHRRSMVEAAFSRLKRGQGGFVKNRSCKGIRAELSLRLINDNLNWLKAILRDFQQSPFIRPVFKADMPRTCFSQS